MRLSKLNTMFEIQCMIGLNIFSDQWFDLFCVQTLNLRFSFYSVVSLVLNYNDFQGHRIVNLPKEAP